MIKTRTHKKWDVVEPFCIAVTSTNARKYFIFKTISAFIFSFYILSLPIFPPWQSKYMCNAPLFLSNISIITFFSYYLSCDIQPVLHWLLWMVLDEACTNVGARLHLQQTWLKSPHPGNQARISFWAFWRQYSAK